MKEALHELIYAGLQRYSASSRFEIPEGFTFDLSISKDTSHGDFASNIAFRLAKLVKKSPNVIAGEIIPMIESVQNENSSTVRIDKVEIAGGGFINFYLTKDALGQILKNVCLQNEKYGWSQYGKSKRVLLEFVSANPTGPLTIAHGRQAAVGDCLARILRAAGYSVSTEYYLNDVGRQMNLLGKSLLARYREVKGEKLKLPEDGYQGAYLSDIAKELDEKIQTEGNPTRFHTPQEELDFFRKTAGETIMKGILKDLEDLDVHFDSYFSERTLYEQKKVDRVFETLTQQGHFYEQDGAVWFRSTEFGDDKDRVVRKSTGENTYLAPDIAYHHEKFNRGFQWLINFLGPDHHGYIARLKAACKALGHNPEALDIRIVQLTTLYRKGVPVRMSTRAGEFVTLRELMDEVGKDATRFFFLSRKIESHLDFDLDLAKQKSQENPVYYLQYAHARIYSLIQFAKQRIDSNVNLALLCSEQETDLIKKIMDFPNAIIRASQVLEPHCLADYLTEVAASFHKFYSAHRVVTDDQALTQARLLLVEASRIVLRNGLSLLGVSQPESM